MSNAYSTDLRERVVAYVANGRKKADVFELLWRKPMESKLLISQFLTFLTARRASTKKVPAIFRSNAVGLPAALLAVTLLASCQADGPIPAALRGEGNDKPLELMIPDSLQKRHEAFRAEFVKATKEGGKVGDAARTIIVDPKFETPV